MVTLSTYTKSAKETDCDAVVFGIFDDGVLPQPLKEIDEALGNSVTQAFKKKAFKAEWKELFVARSLGKYAWNQLIVVGLGKKKELTPEKERLLGGFVAKVAREEGIKRLLVSLDMDSGNLAEGAALGLYRYDEYVKKEKEKLKVLDEFLILNGDQKKIDKATILAEGVNYVRDLVNRPANLVTPEYLANEAKQMSKKAAVKTEVFLPDQLEKKGFGALLAVGQGSVHTPRFVVLQYKPSAKTKIALVGKGITFDSGGLNLKPTRYIEDMKMDMAGAATILALMKIVDRLGIDVGVVGIVPTAENMTGSNAYRPGDIITAYNGITIEVGNTDAEGRLILADALSYASELKPTAIIDVATLTGAVIVALGYEFTGLVSNDDPLSAQLEKASKSTADKVWRLPLTDGFRDVMKGDISDLSNVGKKGKGYEGGTITAGAFLENFVGKDIPWAHLDIGGSAFLLEDTDICPKGATGATVRLLADLLQNWK